MSSNFQQSHIFINYQETNFKRIGKWDLHAQLHRCVKGHQQHQSQSSSVQDINNERVEKAGDENEIWKF